MFLSSIGQDSHRFEREGTKKPLILGGVTIEGCPGFSGNSDADVLLHAITNAVSGISGVNILGKFSDELCLNRGITDSKVYLYEALKTLKGYKIVHVSISIEAARPHLAKHIPAIRSSVAGLLNLQTENVGLTATTGEGLTSFGKGDGMQALVIISAQKTDLP